MLANFLGVLEVAGILHGNECIDASCWADGSQFHEEFVDIHDFRGEVGGIRGCGAGRIGAVVVQFFGDMSVVFQHGAAAGDVDDDGIEFPGIEGCGILVHETDGWFCGTGVIVNRSAAGL
ncbi:hypothetical protein LBMAG46_35120 [Planctomycetia bacterium]|nr:hypothetical protein LBMAG46_35120 [Planctomycetia bacterium]